MALLVLPYRRRDDGGLERVESRPAPPRDEILGTDASREGLWGHDVLRAVGCTLVHDLARGDLKVPRADLDRLEEDARRILREVRRVAEVTEHRVDYIGHRARNVLAAIRLCRDEGGDGVWLGEPPPWAE